MTKNTHARTERSEPRCNVCGQLAGFFEVIKGCRFGQYVLKQKAFETDKFDANLYECGNCGHFFLYGIDNKIFYENEYSEWQGAQGYFGALKENSERKIQKIFEHLNKNNQIGFLDIGCGVGSHMELAKKYFKNVFGIEPSNNAGVAQEKGHTVIKNYFTDELDLDQKFDAFSSLQVLEHVKEPDRFMKALFNKLEPGGAGLINVPNGRLIIESFRYDQIISEHENYFTPKSLIYLAQTAGFEVLELVDDRNSLEIDLYIRKPIQNNRNSTSINLKKINDADNLRKQLISYSSIGIWGAGQKTVSYSALLPENILIAHFFDNDPTKYGYYVSGIGIPIEAPTKEKVSACDAIVIFASSYYSEIKESLENSYGYSGNIVAIGYE